MSDSRANLAGKKVIVGMTGGVDSAMAAFLLKKQGMEVIGLAIIVKPQGFAQKEASLPRCHAQDLDQIRILCERIGISFYATNASAQFDSEVMDKLVANKLLGKANNSCFNCVQTRMQVLFQKMQALEADFMATGHYAKIYRNVLSNEYFIHSNNDEKSDQSFLLAGIPSKIVEKLLLPLGDLSKREVEKYAAHFSLDAKPSVKEQGFCFRSKAATNELLKTRIPKSLIRPGPVENLETGTVQGEHDTVVNYNITDNELEFRGGHHFDKALEVVDYNFSKGTLYIGGRKRLTFRGAQLCRASFNPGLDRRSPISCHVKFKNFRKFICADLFFKNNHSAFLQFNQEVYPLVSGEAVVMYDSDKASAKVIGWGLLGTRGSFKLVNRVKAFESEQDEGAEASSSNFFKF